MCRISEESRNSVTGDTFEIKSPSFLEGKTHTGKVICLQKVKCKDIWFYYFFIQFVFTPFLFPHNFQFHSLCRDIWSICSCIREHCDNDASVFSGQTHTHLHTHRAVRGKQLKDVIGEMRIMGLQFGFGQGECLAAVRQRYAIKTSPFSPPTCSTGELVLSVSFADAL